MANPLKFPQRTGLGRFHVVSSRLNLQHYLWKETLGFNIHPNICPEPTSHIRIAEVAAGTGLWLTEVARSLPDAQVDGFDINLSWMPSPSWMPPNADVRIWDIYGEVPIELVEQYDFVHIRLVNLEVVDNDPSVIVRNLCALLKPGGRIQWDEIDAGSAYIVRTDESIVAPSMEEMKESVIDNMNEWVKSLPVIMRQGGFKDVAMYRFHPRPPFVKYFSDMYLMSMEELAATVFKDTELEQKMQQWIPEMYLESQRGAVICSPLAVCVGKKV